MSISTVSKPTTDFVVTFGENENPEYTYMFDAMHFPAPISKLFQTVMGPAFAEGFTRAVHGLNVPLQSAELTFQNNYLFQAFLPVIPKDEIEAIQLGERAEASMQAELPVMLARWENVHLPRIKTNLRFLETMNVEHCPRHELPSLLDDVVAIAADLWDTHFTIVVPVLLANQLFDEFYADLFGGSEQDAHQLLIGLPSESKKAGVGLSDLAAAAKAAGLDQLLLSTPADKVVDALRTVPVGEYYEAALRDYLREYGLRQDLFDFTVPTWLEDPTIAIANIQSYLKSGHDARAEHERSITDGVKALNAAREQIKELPEAVRGQFEFLVEASRAANFLQEEHNFYIDQRAMAQSRLLFMRLGRRLVADGVLAKADDIFMLTLDEVKLLSSRMLSEKEIGASRILILEREAEMEASARLTPPPFVGAVPSGPPPSGNPMDRAMLRFFGLPIEQTSGSGKLRGNPGSRGYASGIARVARTLDEAKSIQPGEILIAITTMPAWTPLFGTVAALVTETGGPLSHAAIVAREYGIPAVVGATGATRLIQSGQKITVDGSTGVITIEE